MPRAEALYVCQQCGSEHSKWSGQCPSCGQWNVLQEHRRLAVTGRGRAASRSTGDIELTSLDAVEWTEESRLRLGWPEFDRVLGGGLVPGSVLLLGGEPGIGKSTLLMQISRLVAQSGIVLYASGEESPRQIKLRALRLDTVHERISLMATGDVGEIERAMLKLHPALAVVDSIQTVSLSGLDAAAGSVTQVRESASSLLRLAKSTEVPICLVGHVTKQGAIAGPKVLEHLVDTVLYLEGDHSHAFRILRATKNRFGSVDEVGIFEMSGAGLVAVDDPATVLLAEGQGYLSGSVVFPAVEGSRVLLVELQGLVSRCAYGLPRRSANGVDSSRMHMILAVLEKRAGIALGSYDVFLNVAGGVRVVEPAADLGLVMAIVSTLKDVPIAPGTAVMGEVGLTGEVRSVSHAARRIAEARSRGFERCIVPQGNATQLAAGATSAMALLAVRSVTEAIDICFGSV